MEKVNKHLNIRLKIQTYLIFEQSNIKHCLYFYSPTWNVAELLKSLLEEDEIPDRHELPELTEEQIEWWLALYMLISHILQRHR
jgi:hypothetical protein